MGKLADDSILLCLSYVDSPAVNDNTSQFDCASVFIGKALQFLHTTFHSDFHLALQIPILTPDELGTFIDMSLLAARIEDPRMFSGSRTLSYWFVVQPTLDNLQTHNSHGSSYRSHMIFLT